MLSSKTQIEEIASHQGAAPYFPSEHVLFSVRNSTGRLRTVRYMRENRGLSWEYDCALVLNEMPLIQIQSSGCPTCESLLAAGYGLPETGREILEARETLSLPFDGLHTALERLRPVLGLLQPGLYILSCSDCYPTNGEGRFFWDIPEEFTSYKATAAVWDSNCTLPCFPCFLYPSQSAEKYDPARAALYRRMIQKGQPIPPVLACAVLGYMSVLLDGHHRACACALEGTRVPCLTLSRPEQIQRNGVSYLLWPDKSETEVSKILTMEQNRLFQQQRTGERMVPTPAADRQIRFQCPWPPEYTAAAGQYPTCQEAGELALYSNEKLNVEGLRAFILDGDDESIPVAARLLRYAARQPGADVKGLGMAFAGTANPIELRHAAFEILDQLKDDPVVDDVMIQVLVECDRKDDPIYRIADSHWG